MGLVGWAAGVALDVAIEATRVPLKVLGDYWARPAYIPPLVVGASDLDCEGPDDLWPAEEFTEIENFIRMGFDEEVMTRTQWGLRLPNGEVHWDTWMGIPISTPLDRVTMIAKLQQTAGEMGLSEGEQTAEFLNRYGWQTREQTSRISYKNTESYALTDSAVSAAPKEALNHDHHQGSPSHVPDTSAHSYRDLHQGPLGGDA